MHRAHSIRMQLPSLTRLLPVAFVHIMYESRFVKKAGEEPVGNKHRYKAGANIHNVWYGLTICVLDGKLSLLGT